MSNEKKNNYFVKNKVLLGIYLVFILIISDIKVHISLYSEHFILRANSWVPKWVPTYLEIIKINKNIFFYNFAYTTIKTIHKQFQFIVVHQIDYHAM